MKKLLLILMCMILLVGSISAFEFDNRLKYSNNDMKVTIENAFGLGEDLGILELKSHKSVDEIREISYGQSPMYYEFDFKEIYENGLGDVKIINLNNRKEEKLNYYFVQISKEIIETINRTNGEKEYYEKEVYTKYDSKTIPLGKVTIGIMVEGMEIGKKYDGIWEVAGKEISKHAAWEYTSNSYSVSDESGTTGVAYNGTDFAVVGYSDGNISIYWENWTYRGITKYIFQGVDSNPTGIYWNGTEWFVSNFHSGGTNDSIVRLDESFNVLAYWDVSSQTTTPQGVTSDGDYFYVGSSDTLVYQYYKNGTYTDTSFNLTESFSYLKDLQGITYAEGNFYGVQYNGKNISVAKFDTSGNYGGSYYNHSSINTHFRGIGYNEDDNLFYLTIATGTVYEFSGVSPLRITLLNPTDEEILNTNEVTFSTLPTNSIDSTGLNVTIFTNASGSWGANESNTSAFNNTQTNFTISFPNEEGVYLWNALVTDSGGEPVFATSNRTFSVSFSPSINIISPKNNTYLSSTIYFNATNSLGVSYWILNYNGTNHTLDSINSSLRIEEGNHHLLLYGNNSATGDWGINDTIYFTVNVSRVNAISWNTTTYETKSENFIANITTNGTAISNAWLNYNGSTYGATVTNTNGNDYNISYTMDVPIGYEYLNRTFNFTYNIGGTNYSTANNTQNVSLLYFTACNSTYADDSLNLTFKDETSGSYINATIPTSTFTYYIGSGLVNKSYTYTNITYHFNYTFCTTYSNNMNVVPYIQYASSDYGYPQRIWNPSTQSYNNTNFNKILYLLKSEDGLYVTFQVVNTGQQTISGVNVNASREISGTTTLVGQGITGDDGSVTFWLNPDFEHTFYFSKTGYDTYTTSFAPTQSGYTVTLSGGTTTQDSYSRGITKSIIPTNSSLINDTTYTFGFQLNSSYWDVEEYGFNLRLSNGTTIDGGSTGTEATFLTLDYDTNNQTRIYLDYYWLINGNYTNITVYWNVYNTQHTEWSIKTFFTDLTLYMDSGLFGIDDFGKKLLIFLVLFISIGTLGYKYGASDPLFLAGIVFGVIFFFDVAVGLIPSYTTTIGEVEREIQHLYTFLAGLVLALVGMREVMR